MLRAWLMVLPIRSCAFTVHRKVFRFSMAALMRVVSCSVVIEPGGGVGVAAASSATVPENQIGRDEENREANNETINTDWMKPLVAEENKGRKISLN